MPHKVSVSLSDEEAAGLERAVARAWLGSAFGARSDRGPRRRAGCRQPFARAPVLAATWSSKLTPTKSARLAVDVDESRRGEPAVELAARVERGRRACKLGTLKRRVDRSQQLAQGLLGRARIVRGERFAEAIERWDHHFPALADRKPTTKPHP